MKDEMTILMFEKKETFKRKKKQEYKKERKPQKVCDNLYFIDRFRYLSNSILSL